MLTLPGGRDLSCPPAQVEVVRLRACRGNVHSARRARSLVRSRSSAATIPSVALRCNASTVLTGPRYSSRPDSALLDPRRTARSASRTSSPVRLNAAANDRSRTQLAGDGRGRLGGSAVLHCGPIHPARRRHSAARAASRSHPRALRPGDRCRRVRRGSRTAAPPRCAARPIRWQLRARSSHAVPPTAATTSASDRSPHQRSRRSRSGECRTPPTHAWRSRLRFQRSQLGRNGFGRCRTVVVALLRAAPARGRRARARSQAEAPTDERDWSARSRGRSRSRARLRTDDAPSTSRRAAHPGPRGRRDRRACSPRTCSGAM